MPVQIVSNDDYATELVRAHFELEPGLTRIVRLESDNEAAADEPLKLLEVNSETLPLGIRPVGFPARVDDDSRYPPVIIVEVAPDEFERIATNPALLPNQRRLGKSFERN